MTAHAVDAQGFVNADRAFLQLGSANRTYIHTLQAGSAVLGEDLRDKCQLILDEGVEESRDLSAQNSDGYR